MENKLKTIVPKIVHSKVHKHVCALGHNAEHPCMVLYALVESLEMHHIIIYVCYALVGTGVFAIIYEHVFAEVKKVEE